MQVRAVVALAVVVAPLLSRAASAGDRGNTEPKALRLGPADVRLHGPMGRQQLLVTGLADGRSVDLTRKAVFSSSAPKVVAVEPGGVAVARGDGMAEIVAEVGARRARATVVVSGAGNERRVTFERDVMPILTRAGCNGGACHGKARGQNGFALSLLGFDPDYDYAAIASESRGRRVFPAAPEHSLLLKKPTVQMSHGGGRRIEAGGPFYEDLRCWIAAGMPRTPSEEPRVVRISVEPAERELVAGGQQQVVVTAHYSDGSLQDVTHLAAFQSSEGAVVGVDAAGLIKAGLIPGEAAITARFLDFFANCEVTIPLPGEVAESIYERLPRANFIDGLVWHKLKKLGITPSPPASDATFLRRAHIDVIGRLPTPDEARVFLAESDPDKRARLVDRLLERPEYADHWANKWVDLLRPNPYRVGVKAVWNLDAWVRDAFRRNLPYDEFVRKVVTAQGSTFRDGPATIFRDRREPEEIATMMSQLFLGIRLECAKCHHHPFESLGQDQFYGFAAYFARVGRKRTGLSPPISGGEEIVFTARSGSVKHPLTGAVVEPKPIFGTADPVEEPDADPREALARWMTAAGNPFFAQVIVNRVWADLMGRGIVEPVDDLRATNPPSNGPLLEALADDFRRHGYDLKHVIRTIMASSVYALSSEPHPRNVADNRNFSRHYRQRLRAEVLLDAIGDITRVPDTFESSPPGTRASAVWTHRTPSLFLDTFGRPDPNLDPPCERTSDTSVVQALHLMNAPGLNAKITSDDGLPARLARSGRPPREIVEELYLWAYSRPPSSAERAEAEDLFREPGANPRRAAEDLLWALLNSPELLFKD
jgi:hypothetical protein